MRRTLLVVMVPLVAFALAAACGGSDESPSSTGGGSGGSGGPSTGGSGGSSTGGSAGTGPAGGGSAGVDASLDGSGDAALDAPQDSPSDVQLTDGSANTVACLTFHTKFANKAKECTQGNPVPWGAETVDRWIARCSLDVAATGAPATMNDIVTCAAQFEKKGCAEFMASALSQCIVDPTAAPCRRFDPVLVGCTPPAGTLTNGTACFGHLQCAGGYCKGHQNGCGVCAPRAGVGQACTEGSDCQVGLACSQSKCATPLGLGASCSTSSAPCAYGTHCKSGKCAAWAGAGQPCGGALGACDPRFSLTCNAGTCAKLSYAKTGGACSGPLAICYDESVCSGGTCVSQIDDGSTCNPTLGCKAFSSCRGGACTRDDPGYCF
ncbi:MAG: hypothetical protein IT375_26990 [Polyangiaceae bacterium]|nr:hypothetical protein [Polyangiaceae bacterium]